MEMYTIFPIDSLVLYKKHPARVRQGGERLEIDLANGELIKVRPKDVILLHPGPLRSLGELVDPAGEVETAWEILTVDDQSHSLRELAELAYGEFTPATAWAAWRQLEDGLLFEGTPEAVRARSPEAVAVERASRQGRAQQALAWVDFLQRAGRGEVSKEQDRRYLHEIEDLALGKRAESRALRELGHAERPETAHAWLLENHTWDEQVNPYPARLGVTTAPVILALGELPDEPRRDLTHLAAFAIDDQGNQDPDDALSLDGERLWVHVADVAALVPPGSPLDAEARARGANLYLPEGTVGMLPTALVERLGLGLNEISPALSFGLDLNEAGELQSFEILPSRVRVQRLSYEQAEDLLEQEPFQGLERLAQVFQQRRLANGAVEIDLPETIVRVVEGQVTIRPVLNLRSRALVKEAMLMAGEAAARFALQHNLAFPFTSQESPDPAVLEEIMNRLGGPRLPVEPDLALAFAVRRAQKRGLVSSQPGPHTGLGLPVYTRATSPLRRYSDLAAHQQLRACLRGEPPLDEATLLERVGEADVAAGSVNQAEGLSRRHWTLVFLQQHPGWQGEGVLVEKRNGRGKVLIPELALEVQIHLRKDILLNSRIPLAIRGINLAELEAYF